MKANNKCHLSLWFILLVALLSWNGCNTAVVVEEDEERPDFQLSAEGEEGSLEIVTWNIMNFPSQGDKSVDWVAKIIQQLDIDIYALQEIADVNAFQDLVDRLPGYEGIYSTDSYSDGYQKTGLVYKTGIVTVLSREMLFEDREYAFPRPPMMLDIQASHQGKTFDFYLIVMHLKAYQDQENIERRRAAAQALKDYMDTRISDPGAGEKDYIIAGDWNDEIDDPPAENSFQVFIQAPGQYRFLTEPLAGDPANASYPGYGSLIDHILISADCFAEYQGGACRTLILDSQVNSYMFYVSDHRPVLSLFPVFN